MVDWFPTLVKLAGGSLTQQHPLDGRDAWPAITQGAPSPHTDILHNITPTGGAVRMGDWKLVVGGRFSEVEEGAAAGGKAGKKAGKKKAGKKANSASAPHVELFNVKNDPYEKTNLADQEPERVKELRARLDAYAKAAVPAKQTPQPRNYKAPPVWGEAP
jgi:arylsulfatase A-like enzyme